MYGSHESGLTCEGFVVVLDEVASVSIKGGVWIWLDQKAGDCL